MSSIVNKSSTRFKPRQPSRGGPSRKLSRKSSATSTPDEYTRLPGLSGSSVFGGGSGGGSMSFSSPTTSKAIRNKIHHDLADTTAASRDREVTPPTSGAGTNENVAHRRLLEIVQSSENENALAEDDSYTPASRSPVVATVVASMSSVSPKPVARTTVMKVKKPLTAKVDRAVPLRAESSSDAEASGSVTATSIEKPAEDGSEDPTVVQQHEQQDTQAQEPEPESGSEHEVAVVVPNIPYESFDPPKKPVALRRSTRKKNAGTDGLQDSQVEEATVSESTVPVSRTSKVTKRTTTKAPSARALRSNKEPSPASPSTGEKFNFMSFSRPLRPRTSHLRGSGKSDDEHTEPATEVRDIKGYAELASQKLGSAYSATETTATTTANTATTATINTTITANAATSTIPAVNTEEENDDGIDEEVAEEEVADDTADITWGSAKAAITKPRASYTNLPYYYKAEETRKKYDDQGREIIGREDLNVHRRVDNDEAANRVIDVESVTMGDMCASIPVGRASSKHEKLMEITRKKRKEQQMLRDQRLMVRNDPRSLFEFRTELQKRDAARRQQNQQDAKHKLATDGSPATAVVPQLRIGEGGSFSVDVESTVVDRHKNNAIDENQLERVDADDTERPVNSGSYSRHERPERWYPEETELFYRAISMWGTDFNLISKLFPGRSRRQVKSKYKLEERKNPAKLHLATIRKLPVDMNAYTESLDIQAIHIRDVNEVSREIENVKQEFEQRLVEDAEALKRSKEEDAAKADRVDQAKLEQRAAETFQSTLQSSNSVSVKTE